MTQILNRVKVNTSTTGTGTVSLGSAVSPYQTWSNGSAVSGLRYSYLIEDGAAWEVGEGVYTSGSPGTMTRNLIASSTGSLLVLSGAATIACVAKATDLPQTLARIDFAGGETSFSFTNIRQDFRHLKMILMGRMSTSGFGNIPFTMNASGSSIYDVQRAYGLGTTWTVDNTLTGTSFGSGVGILSLPGSNFPAGQAATLEVDIYNYTNTSFWKQLRGHVARWPQSTTTGEGYDLQWSAQYRSTSAITSIETPTFAGSAALAAGSSVELIGIP